MKALAIFISLTFLTIHVVAQQSEQIPWSIESRLPLRDNHLSASARDFNRSLWKSQFKSGMRASPDGFKDLTFRKYFGTSGQKVEDLKVINDNIIRYGKNIPGLGTGFSLLEEFARDTRKWGGGIEERKSAAIEAMNRCPECIDAFADDAYKLLRKKAGGGVLTPDENIFYEGLKSQLTSGAIVDVDSPHKTLIERANPNDVTLLNTEKLTQLLKSLTSLSKKDYQQAMTNDAALRTLLEGNMIDLRSGIKEEFKQLNSTFKKMAQEKLDAEQRQKRTADFETRMFELHAASDLMSTILRLTGKRDEARQLSAVIDASLSVYGAIGQHLNDPAKMTQFAATATSINGFLTIASIMSTQQQKSENAYVLEAIAGLRDQIRVLQSSVDRLDNKLTFVATKVDQLLNNSNRQFSTLLTAAYEQRDSFTQANLKSWSDRRQKVFDKIKRTSSDCRASTDKAINFESANDQQRTQYRDNCLLKLLQYATIDATSETINDVPRRPFKSDASIALFTTALQAGIPVELWVGRLGDAIPTLRNAVGSTVANGQTGAPQIQYAPGAEPEPFDETFDVEIWNKAIYSYAVARLAWPTYAPSPNRSEDKEILRMEAKAQESGDRMGAWILKRLSMDRFTIATDAYREAAVDVLGDLTALTEAFLVQKQAEWCSKESLASLMETTDEAAGAWMSSACSTATQPNLVEITGAYYKSAPLSGRPTIIPPDILLFQKDYFNSAARLSMANSIVVNGVGTKGGMPLVLGKPGWFSDDEEDLLLGLRAISSANIILGRLAPDSRNSIYYKDLKVNYANVYNEAELWSCLEETVKRLPAGDIEGSLQACTIDNRKGCNDIRDKTTIGAFRFKLCDGPIKLNPSLLQGFRSTLRRNGPWQLEVKAAIDMLNIGAASESYFLRRHGLSNDIITGPGAYCSERPNAEKDGCIRNLKPNAWRDDYVLSIIGIGDDGILAANATLKKAAQIQGFNFNLEETYDLAKIDDALSEVNGPLSKLNAQWREHLSMQVSFDRLKPSLERLNEAYANLLLHTMLHLQMSGKQSDATRDFLQLPISGYELANFLAKREFPSDLPKRLLLATDAWKRSFATVKRIRKLQDSYSFNDCAPPAIDINILGQAGKAQLIDGTPGAERRRAVTDDLYCRMWSDQIDAFKNQPPPRYLTESHRIFKRGSDLVEDGLDVLARVRNEAELRRVAKNITASRSK